MISVDRARTTLAGDAIAPNQFWFDKAQDRTAKL